MAIGTSWASGSWATNAWATNTWADASAWTVATYNGATAFGVNGQMGTAFLDDATAVPATAFVVNGFAHTQAGMRYVALWPASGVAYTTGEGVAVRSDGAMIIAPGGTIADDHAGMALTYRGEVVVSTAAPTFFDDGLGLLQDGTLCVSEMS